MSYGSDPYFCIRHVFKDMSIPHFVDMYTLTNTAEHAADSCFTAPKNLLCMLWIVITQAVTHS